MLEMKLIVKGMVQGVGYRYSIVAQVEAQKLDLTGHVMNLADGSVEIVGQGNIEQLKKLREIALEGSARSSVREIIESDLSPVENEVFCGFSVKL
jgi:acylphosphatase